MRKDVNALPEPTEPNGPGDWLLHAPPDQVVAVFPGSPPLAVPTRDPSCVSMPPVDTEVPLNAGTVRGISPAAEPAGVFDVGAAVPELVLADFPQRVPDTGAQADGDTGDQAEDETG